MSIRQRTFRVASVVAQQVSAALRLPSNGIATVCRCVALVLIIVGVSVSSARAESTSKGGGKVTVRREASAYLAEAQGASKSPADSQTSANTARPSAGEMTRADSLRANLPLGVAKTAGAIGAMTVAGGPATQAGMTALLWIIIAGALGGFAADVLTHGGRFDPPRRDEAGFSLGTLGHMFIGAIAAIIVMSVSPPTADTAYLTLLGKALAAGVGGEAILLAIVNSKKANAATTKLDAANQRLVEVKDDAAAQLKHVERVALNEVDAMSQLAGGAVRALLTDGKGDPPPVRAGVRDGADRMDEEEELEGGLSGSRGRHASTAGPALAAGDLADLVRANLQRARANIESAAASGPSEYSLLPAGPADSPDGPV